MISLAGIAMKPPALGISFATAGRVDFKQTGTRHTARTGISRVGLAGHDDEIAPEDWRKTGMDFRGDTEIRIEC